MIVKPGHPYVEPDGSVFIPYMSTWIPNSSLRDLVNSLMIIFG